MEAGDILIAGAGVIGLSLALELCSRGAGVTVVEAGHAHGQASTAAAGMLAADDPHNPAEMQSLARYSIDRYNSLLEKIEELCGIRVGYQTSTTLQAFIDAGDGRPDLIPQLVPGPNTFVALMEHSIDPRQLAPALLKAVRAAGITVLEHTPMTRLAADANGVRIEAGGNVLQADYFVDCMGTWSPAPVAPVKGQMLAVKLPASLPLDVVVRTQQIYVVPRTIGPNQGRAIIGATVEDAGFDTAVHALDMLTLNAHACALLPALAEATFLESWAGLRPATLDGLPILGFAPRQTRSLLATGHYRNGILLAPATAQVIADLIEGKEPVVDLAAFRAERFQG